MQQKREAIDHNQIDLLKAIAIILVIINHSLPWYYEILAPFWTRASIPIFMIIMGFNANGSFRRRKLTSLRQLYGGSYFKRKASRYLFPFLILFACSFLAGLYFDALEINWSILLGILPFWGPGNWFIPVIFTSVLFLPMVVWSFQKFPKATLVGTFLIDLGMHFLYTTFIRPTNPEPFSFVWTIIRCNVLMLFFAVGLGLWISNDHQIWSRHNYPILAAAVLSIVYLWMWTFPKIEFPFLAGDYVPFVYPYSALLVLLGIRLLPNKSDGIANRVLKTIGKATYHILLFQIFYFSVVFQLFPSIMHEGMGEVILEIAYCILNIGLSLSFGVAWYTYEMRARRWYESRSLSESQTAMTKEQSLGRF